MIFKTYFLCFSQFVNAHVLHVAEITAEFSKEMDGVHVSTENEALWKIETGESSFLLFDRLPQCDHPVISKRFLSEPEGEPVV